MLVTGSAAAEEPRLQKWAGLLWGTRTSHDLESWENENFPGGDQWAIGSISSSPQRAYITNQTPNADHVGPFPLRNIQFAVADGRQSAASNIHGEQTRSDNDQHTHKHNAHTHTHTYI